MRGSTELGGGTGLYVVIDDSFAAGMGPAVGAFHGRSAGAGPPSRRDRGTSAGRAPSGTPLRTRRFLLPVGPDRIPAAPGQARSGWSELDVGEPGPGVSLNPPGSPRR
ncbi:hypothetical protein GCM10022204_26250 [Microlunatus aurantiacus]|uniref:Uncharacterized protein n=1 Tax=Microlunatus aurantiacus TaxID=446786 RepID=A0ABP7DL11_9ACTN